MAPTAAANRSQSATNHSLQAPFLSTNVRFMEDQNLAAMPGPGTYKQPTLAESIAKKPWGK